MVVPCQELKFLSLVTYFYKVKQRIEKKADYYRLASNISFHRNVRNLQSCDDWKGLNVPLVNLRIEREFGILEWPEDALRVDFANMFIGGGVLQDGNVQEELYFAVHPELYLSMLFCEVMDDNEAIVIVGAERVAEYSGYGSPAKFTKVHDDMRVLDREGRLNHHMVAIDARPYNWDSAQQFSLTETLRELNKARIGFNGDEHETPACRRPIVTGNWGCGMFCGDPQLKSLLQWIAATAAARDVVYMVHKDRRLTHQFEEIEEKYRGTPANALLTAIWKVIETHGKSLNRSSTLFEQLLHP